MLRFAMGFNFALLLGLSVAYGIDVCVSEVSIVGGYIGAAAPVCFTILGALGGHILTTLRAD